MLALVSAMSFGMSGTIARTLLDTGWSAGAAVTARIAVAGLVLLPAALWAARRHMTVLAQRRVWGAMASYGLIAIAVPQLCYFYAVTTLQVGVALLIEYTAPVAVMLWMWLRHAQRPTPITVGGAAVAALGLAMVLQVFGGVALDPVGVAWALGAMLGAAGYFILSAHAAPELPGITLATGGLLVAAAGLGVLGLVGLLPMAASTADVTLGDAAFAWWQAVALLALVTAALAYVTGIAATRRLGPRLASFVALSEVVAAVLFAWALLGQVPAGVQLAGGALILVGVIAVKLGERAPIRPDELDLVEP